MDDLQRRPGRPRKWSSDAERMRADRARERERTARLVDPADAPEALIENGKLRERIVQLEAERDRLWAQIVRLQGELRASATAIPSTSSSPPPSVTDHRMPETRVDGEPSGIGLPCAERRRRERGGASRTPTDVAPRSERARAPRRTGSPVLWTTVPATWSRRIQRVRRSLRRRDTGASPGLHRRDYAVCGLGRDAARQPGQ